MKSFSEHFLGPEFTPGRQLFPLMIFSSSPIPFHRCRSLSLAQIASVLFAISLCVGCGDQGEIRQYTVEPENQRIFTSDALKDEFGAIPFEWDAPKSWTVAKNDQFSKVAWEVGPKVDGGRITVSAVGMGMGLMSQVTRWRGQIGLEQSEKDDPMAGTEQIKLNGGTATFIDLTGEKESIQGMMFPHGDSLWVFKFRGSNTVAKEEKERFRKFCESVKIP